MKHNLDTCISTFKNKIREGPYYICSICNRLLYRKTVNQPIENTLFFKNLYPIGTELPRSCYNTRGIKEETNLPSPLFRTCWTATAQVPPRSIVKKMSSNSFASGSKSADAEVDGYIHHVSDIRVAKSGT
jgi:hypothetical protein